VTILGSLQGMKRSSITDKKAPVQSHVVLEIGSTHVRGGFAGECVPRFVIPTPFRFTNKSALGEQLSTSEIRIICLEGLRMIFLEYLQIRSKDCSVLVIENMFAVAVFRDQLFNVLLNEMQIQAVCFQSDMLMPLLATGCSSGIVVDVGSEECRALCIAHGRPLLNTFVATPIGVNQAAKRFHRLLSSCDAFSQETKGEINEPPVLSEAFTETLFERVAVADTDDETAVDVRCVYEGTEVMVQGWLRSDCLTSLIAGDDGDEDSHDEVGGLLGLILACILKCSADVRCIGLKNIVLAGGGAQLPGLPEAVCRKLCTVLNSPSEAKSMTCADNINRLRPLFSSDAFTEGVSGGSAVLSPDSAMKLLAQHSFPKSSLNWIGGSLFASVKANRASKYVERDEYLLFSRNTATAAKKDMAKSGEKVGHDIDDLVLMRAPDWLSTNPNDWRFYGSGKNSAAKQQGWTTASGSVASRGRSRQQVSSGSSSVSASAVGSSRGGDAKSMPTSSPSSFFQSLL